MRKILVCCLAGVLVCCTMSSVQARKSHHRSTDDTADTEMTQVQPGKSADDQPMLVFKDNGVTPNNPEAKIPVKLPAKETPAQPAPQPRSLFWQSINMILNLLLVLGVMYLVMLGIKKYSQGGGSVKGTGGLSFGKSKHLMQVLETVSLGQGRNIHLLAVAGRTFVVGATGQQVALLEEVTGNEDIEEHLTSVQESAVTSGPGVMSFLALLNAKQSPQGETSVGRASSGLPATRQEQTGLRS
ncbi:MAG: FliO/MopB family protein [Armatimonadota bacterium]